MLFCDFAATHAAPEMGVPLEKQRWWTWAKRQNSTYRPASPLTEQQMHMRVMDIKENMTSTYSKPTLTSCLNLFLETDQSPTDPWAGPLHALPTIARQYFLLFLKFYDPEARTLKVQPSPLLYGPACAAIPIAGRCRN